MALVACPTEDDGDDGVPTASFAAATSTITEEGASGTIGVALDADAGADGVAVQFGVVSDGTTAEDDDWQITTGSGVEAVSGSATTWTVAIPSGMRSATITVTAPDDADGDGGVVIFELQSGTGYGIGSANRHTLTITDNDAEPVFSGAPYSFDIGEGDYSESSPGAVGTVSATNATRYTITEGDSDMRFAIDSNGAITAVGALDFEDTAIPNSYDLTVTAHNGADADAPSATATVTIMVTDLQPGLASVSYTIEVGEDGIFGSLNGVSASGTTLNLGPLSTVDGFDPTAFTIAPSSPFTLTKAAGLASEAMLTADAADLDFEDSSKPNSYTLTVEATGATNNNTITLEITVTDVDYGVTGAFTVQEDTTDPQTVTLAPVVSPIYEIVAITTITITSRSKDGATVATDDATFEPGGTDNAMVAASSLAWEIVDEYTLAVRAMISGGTEAFTGEVEDIVVTVTVDPAPGFLNSQPTLFLREDGMFVAVGDTTLATPSNTIDLAAQNIFSLLTKGDFMLSGGITLGSFTATQSGAATFDIPASSTELTAAGDPGDFEAANTPVYSLPITADGTANSETITGAMTTLTVEIADFQDGDSDEPYTIASVTELQSIDTGFSNEVITTALSREDSLAAHYLLTADLDVTGDSDAIANFDPIGDCGGDDCDGFPDNDNEFTGGFDGGGYTIANLTINRSSLDGVGLFAIASGVSIRNLFLQDVDITGSAIMGGLVGLTQNISSVRFVAVTGTMSSTGADVGAIIGSSSALNYFAVFGNVAISGTAEQRRALLTGSSIRSGTVRYINSHAAGTVENSGTAANIVGNANHPSARIFYNVYGRGEIKGDNSGLIGAVRSSDVTATNVYWDTQSSTQSLPIEINVLGELPTVEEWATMGITGLDTAGMQGLTASTSNWQTEFSPGIDLDGDRDVDDTDDVHLSVRCDANGDGTVGASEWLWDFGTTSQYPALNCMPITLTEQREANRQ